MAAAAAVRKSPRASGSGQLTTAPAEAQTPPCAGAGRRGGVSGAWVQSVWVYGCRVHGCRGAGRMGVWLQGVWVAEVQGVRVAEVQGVQVQRCRVQMCRSAQRSSVGCVVQGAGCTAQAAEVHGCRGTGCAVQGAEVRVQRCWVCSTRCRVHSAGVQRCMEWHRRAAQCRGAGVQDAEMHGAEEQGAGLQLSQLCPGPPAVSVERGPRLPGPRAPALGFS